MTRYWYHPESESLFTSPDDEQPNAADPHCEEINEAKYLNLQQGGSSCRYCDGSGWFYGDRTLGPCVCPLGDRNDFSAMFEDLLGSSQIFVFGSNRAGRHGKGAALWARQHRGAIYGQGEGLQGESYGIPTKDANLQTLPLDEITHGVVAFLELALSRPDLTFEVTPIGCGLAGYTPKDIAWMFDAPCPRNVILPPEFRAVLG